MHLVCPACGTIHRIPDARLRDAPVCGRCGAAQMPAEPVNLTDAALPGVVARTERPVLVDFWADWCGPYKQMAPHFAAAAQQTAGVRFAKVDSDAAPVASARHGIRSILTLILFKRGAEVARLSSVVPAAQWVSWIQRHLQPGVV